MVFRNFKMRVSATQIYKFDFKFERKKVKAPFFSLDKPLNFKDRADRRSCLRPH